LSSEDNRKTVLILQKLKLSTSFCNKLKSASFGLDCTARHGVSKASGIPNQPGNDMSGNAASSMRQKFSYVALYAP